MMTTSEIIDELVELADRAARADVVAANNGMNYDCDHADELANELEKLKRTAVKRIEAQERKVCAIHKASGIAEAGRVLADLAKTRRGEIR